MYQISEHSGKIKNTVSGIVFPNDERDINYPAYYAWLSENNTPVYIQFFEGEEEEKNRSLLPKIVSQRQLRTQLVLNGFNLDAIQTAINGLSEPDKSIAQIAWDYAITFERNSPLLVVVGQMLGLSESDIDTIFLNASAL